MENSLFLAQIIGPILIVVAAGILLRQKNLFEIIDELGSSKALLFISGLFSLIIGILLLLHHNVWVWSWEVVITFIGWGAFIKGVLLIIIPEIPMSIAKLWKCPFMPYITGFVVLLFGGCLTYQGFLGGL